MRTIIIGLISGFLLAGSCTKDKNDDNYWGYANAQKNGQSWSGKIAAANNTRIPDRFDIVIDRYNAESIQEENLGFQNIPKIPGRNRLYKIDFVNYDPQKTTAVLFTNREDGDVQCDLYNVIETDSINNFIQIDSYNQNNNEVKGRFALKLIIRLPKCRNNAPDTLVFINGDFHTKIK